MNTKSHIKARPAPEPDRRHFTVEEANRALPYVSRIARDIRASYRQAVSLQERLDQSVPDDDTDQLRDDYEQTITTLNRYVDELHDVGVELKDYEVGLVDFPAHHDGREIYLCWKSGEAKVHAWHETNAGFPDRHDVAELTSKRKRQ